MTDMQQLFFKRFRERFQIEPIQVNIEENENSVPYFTSEEAVDKHLNEIKDKYGLIEEA